MAGLEALTNAIYHEKQQPGEMLCAQHALNAVLRAWPSVHYCDLIFLTKAIQTYPEGHYASVDLYVCERRN
jgi:hypothetical protein